MFLREAVEVPCMSAGSICMVIWVYLSLHWLLVLLLGGGGGGGGGDLEIHRGLRNFSTWRDIKFLFGKGSFCNLGWGGEEGPISIFKNT